jgi:hypothetical protein
MLPIKNKIFLNPKRAFLPISTLKFKIKLALSYVLDTPVPLVCTRKVSYQKGMLRILS